MVKNHNKDKDKVAVVIDMVKSNGGIAYAREKMLEYRQKAIDILNTFPSSQAKDSLEKLVIFTTERNK